MNPNEPIQISDEAREAAENEMRDLPINSVPLGFHTQKLLTTSTASLKNECNQLRTLFLKEHKYTCLHHTDAERAEAHCPVCLRKQVDEYQKLLLGNMPEHKVTYDLYHENKQLQSQLEEADDDYATCMKLIKKQTTQLEELKTMRELDKSVMEGLRKENEELKRDRERLDWLNQHLMEWDLYHEELNNPNAGFNVRAELDNAIKASKS